MTNPFANPYTPTAPAPAGPVNPFANPVPVPAVPTFPGALSPQEMTQVAAPAPATAPPALDFGRLTSAAAPVVGEGRGAALADMYGRLVLFFPLALQRVPRNPQFISQEQRARGDVDQDRLTATIVVLDDGQGGQQPIAYGGKPYAMPPSQHTDQAPLPYIRKAMWINQSRLISQLRDGVPSAPGQAPGMIAGRIAKVGPAPTDPWYLIGATEPEVALVRQYLELVQAGQQPHPLA